MDRGEKRKGKGRQERKGGRKEEEEEGGKKEGIIYKSPVI